jgi:hypothetical protein
VTCFSTTLSVRILKAAATRQFAMSARGISLGTQAELAVNDPTVKCLMAHTVQDEDIGTHYEGTTPAEMVAAIRKWDALLSAVPAAVAV